MLRSLSMNRSERDAQIAALQAADVDDDDDGAPAVADAVADAAGSVAGSVAHAVTEAVQPAAPDPIDAAAAEAVVIQAQSDARIAEIAAETEAQLALRAADTEHTETLIEATAVAETDIIEAEQPPEPEHHTPPADAKPQETHWYYKRRFGGKRRDNEE